MNARTASIGIVSLMLLAGLGGIGVVVLRGAGAPALTGLAIGLGLGFASLLAESLSLSWAMRHRLSATMAVSLSGFLVRLVVVSGLTILFSRIATVDAAAFALSFVATFLAFLGVQVWAITRTLDGNRASA